MRKLYLLFMLLLVSWLGHSQKVAIHDPSIVVVYKDASGNSFPENDAANTRTKYYYVFGTHLGGAYSRDLINWTPFTPSMLLNGNVSTQYYQIFKEEADFAMHYDDETVRGNLWAPDVIYNKSLNKWCMYFSMAGNEFKSSIVLLTSDHIEGPYQKVGDVVFSGFRNNEGSIARDDYAIVTGSNTVDGRYLNNGEWFNDYGVSCIDPAVLYDENGQLWMNYGSWSGGIFLLKLDNNTGLRDYSFSYGSNPVWNGSRLRSDPYLGYHIAGGYYVSGEGPYIEYIEDVDGQGYYYMFVTMGFYDPNTGYTMRVYKSSTIDGVYRDISGTDAVFANWVFNYGNNMTYGFPIMQNYRWNWWSIGQTSQGHNSLLQDEDGTDLLIYHTKYDNETYHHNVEVHQLFHPENGWIVASPFEYRKGFGVQEYKEYTAEDIAGVYGVIIHNPVDYENYATNREEVVYLNADGTITGAYSGNWLYNYAVGKQYVTLTTNVGTFQAVFCEELMDDLSTHTLAFTGVNNSNERAIWGYKYTKTATTTTTNYSNQALTVGEPDYSLAWNAYEQFHRVDVTGEFEVEFVFDNFTEAVENWHNWALYMTDGNSNWYLRADAWSNETFTGATVNYQYNWSWDTEYKEVFANKEVRIVVSRVGTTINVIAFVEGEQVYVASSKNSTEDDLTIHLGGEAVYLDVKKSSVSQLDNRQAIGVTTDHGTYTSGFNAVFSPETTVADDFEVKYSFYNHRQAFNTDNWDNYILRASSGGQTMLLRADAYALDPIGTVNHTYDWAWEDFAEMMMGAYIEMTITRVGGTVTYDAEITATDGQVYHYVTTNTGAPTGEMTFSLTLEQSMVDLIETEIVNYTLCANESTDTDQDGLPDCVDECPNDGNKTEPGVCGCGATEESCLDCEGTPNGDAYYDNCDICVEGNTGLMPCTQDCAGDWGGTAVYDACNQCAGGETGVSPVVNPEECLATSLNQHEDQSQIAYPNPTNSRLYLKQTASWTLLDMTGVELKKGNSHTLTLEGYSPGIYYLRVGNKVMKIVKE